MEQKFGVECWHAHVSLKMTKFEFYQIQLNNIEEK